MSTTPSGRLVGDDLVLERSYPAPRAQVWSAITESDQLERWIGRYEGDPASGQVDFYMTAEGDDVSAEKVVIDSCHEPRLLAVTQATGGQSWQLRAELTEQDGGTQLTFTHHAVDAEAREMIGPGWEFYLDRLGAVLAGQDVSTINWDRDYFPAMAEHYRNLGA